MLRRLLPLLLLGALLGGPACADDREPEFLPDLQLPTIDGKTIATWELRGKKLLLIEFASW